jgi:hypothetical protein
MDALLMGSGVGCALTRLLRPERNQTLEVLSAWPLTVPDVLGGPAPLSETIGFGQVCGGAGNALERLLRPDRQVMLLAIDSLELTVEDVLVRTDLGARGEPPAEADAA